MSFNSQINHSSRQKEWYQPEPYFTLIILSILPVGVKLKSWRESAKKEKHLEDQRLTLMKLLQASK
jgi:hypothetical protein